MISSYTSKNSVTKCISYLPIILQFYKLLTLPYQRSFPVCPEISVSTPPSTSVSKSVQFEYIVITPALTHHYHARAEELSYPICLQALKQECCTEKREEKISSSEQSWLLLQKHNNVVKFVF